MPRILAFDYGSKRVGLAVSDSLQLTANGLCTLGSHEVFPFIKKYLEKEEVEVFVVGYAKQMNNQDSASMKYIHVFVAALKNKYPQIPVVYVDERFTSVMAQQTILAAGLKKSKRQDKALVDQVSATIILQSYMESKRSL